MNDDKNDKSLENLVASADPVTTAKLNRLDLDSAQDELMHGILATETRSSETEPTPAPKPSRPRWRLSGIGIGVAAVCGILVAIFFTGSGSEPGSSGTAWAAEQVRFAEASPLVLLDMPGWQADYANEESETAGQMSFVRGSAAQAENDPLRTAFLNWEGGSLAELSDYRAEESISESKAPVLDTTARVFNYGKFQGTHIMIAMWKQDGRVLEFSSNVPIRSGKPYMGMFEEQLAALKQVDADQWLTALPASSIPTADRSLAVDEMLKGIPLPPGFDSSEIKGAELTKDSYQLGAAVTGTVACTWIDLWSDGRAGGSKKDVRAAIDAMATAGSWPILREMTREGDYPEVVEEFAVAMKKGNWYGRPLEGDADEALGCDALGIDLKNR